MDNKSELARLAERKAELEVRSKTIHVIAMKILVIRIFVIICIEFLSVLTIKLSSVLSVAA